MKMKLWEMTEDALALLSVDCEDEGHAEAIGAALEQLQGDFEAKAEKVIQVRRTSEAHEEALDKEIKRLQAAKKAEQARQQHLNDYLSRNMQALGFSKMNAGLFKVTLKAAAKVVVVDDDKQLPDDLVSVETVIKADKAEIARRLKAGQEVTGAHLEDGKRALLIG